jgi:transcription elongation factor/antiterminator RfaH
MALRYLDALWVGAGPEGSGEVILAEGRFTEGLASGVACAATIEGGAQQGVSLSERWYLVFTGPNQEQRAVLNLERQGFRPFLPRILKSVRHARSIRMVVAPLFPRYVFLPLDLDRDRWLSVRSTFGVSSLYMSGSRPGPVPCGVVEAILDQVDVTGTARLDAGLDVGDEVRVLSGPFADLVGTLNRLDDNGRVRVLLDIMGKSTPVTLPRSALMPA